VWYDCNPSTIQRQAQDLGYAAVLFPLLTEWMAFGQFSVTPYRQGVPVLFPALTDAEIQMPIGEYLNVVNCFFLLSALLYGGDPGMVNATVAFDYPVASASLKAYSTYSGNLFSVQWIGFSFSLIVMIVATFKYTQMYTLENGVRMSVPQTTIVFCFLTGVFCMITAFNMALANPNMRFLLPASTFFQQWPFACIFTALIILGFYMREISLLTSSSHGAVLEKMKIPACIVVSLLWIVVILASGLGLGVCGNQVCQSSKVFSQFAFAMFVIIATATFAFLTWGCVSVLMTLDRSSKNFWAVLLVVVLCMTSCVSSVVLGILFETLFWIFAFNISTVALFVNASVSSYQAMLPAFEIFGPVVSAFLILMIFRVSVSKEIELSKSATSSTSASSKSSSSSSSASENIVEL